MLPSLHAASPQHDLSTSPPTLSLKNVSPSSANTPSFGSISDYADSPRTPKRLTFTLSPILYQWLEAMAVTHNYGSVHKSVRDILEWANTGKDDDMQWLFATPHQIPHALRLDIQQHCLSDASNIAGKQACIPKAGSNQSVVLHARLSDTLHQWIAHCVVAYHLDGPSHLLETVLRCAIQLGAEHDIFDSAECGQGLPSSSAELYHDLGIMRYAANDDALNFASWT